MANETVVELQFDPIFGTVAKKKLVKESEELGKKSGSEFAQGFSSRLSGVNRKFGSAISSGLLMPLKALRSEFLALGAAIGTGVLFKKAIQESSRLQDSLIGLKSVGSAFGLSVDSVTREAQRLAQDGLIPLEDVTSSLKNLIVNFDGDLQKSVETFDALKNAAAFNRQGQLSLGEAIKGAAEGLKNDLSIKVDNAGVTKNLSIIQKEYAASIGTTVGRLTEAQKSQAEYVGIIREASIFQGDYNKLTQTFSGAVTGLETSFRFLLSAIGDLITKSPATLAVINTLTTSIQGLTRSVNGIGGEGFKNVLLTVAKFGETISKYVVAPLEFAIDAFGLFFRFVNTGAAAIVTSISTIGTVVSDMIKAISGENAVTQALDNFDSTSTQVLTDNINGVKEAWKGAFGFESSEAITQWFSGLATNIETTKPGVISFGKTLDGVDKGMNKLSKRAQQTAKIVNTAVNRGIAQSATMGIQALTKSLLLGEDGFKNFGKKMAGMLGDMATQLGTTLIFSGLGIEALKSLGGAAAIAAGAGLVAFGTILKSFSGGSGGSEGAAAGGIGGGGLTDSFADAPIEDELQEPAEPDTKVAITVQGDIFDSDETGVRIASILEDAALNQNVKVVGFA